MLTRAGVALSLTGGTRLTAHLLVVGLVLSEDFLAHFFASLMNIRVEFVAVLLDRELLVIINWNENLLCANWFLVGIMELVHVRMLESLLCSQSLVGVELKQVLEEIKSVLAGGREHVAQLLGLGGR